MKTKFEKSWAGTLTYLAPELIPFIDKENAPYNPKKSDAYSLGVVLS
jgi:hypothetical protein